MAFSSTAATDLLTREVYRQVRQEMLQVLQQHDIAVDIRIIPRNEGITS